MEEIDEIISYLAATEINLKKMKVVKKDITKELSTREEYHTGTILNKIKKCYENAIIKSIPEEKIVRFKYHKTHSKKNKQISSFFKKACLASFCFSLAGLILSLFTVLADNEIYSKIGIYTYFLSSFFVISFGSVNFFITQKRKSQVRESLFNKKNEFKNSIREITMRIIDNLSDEKKYNGKMKESVNDLKEYLVKENYLLEKGNKNIFNSMKKGLEENIVNYIDKLVVYEKIEDKKIIFEEPSQFDAQLNFLINSKEVEKNKQLIK